MNARPLGRRVLAVPGQQTEDRIKLALYHRLEVHRTGKLHRAFSIFIFDDQRRLLLQRRAEGKYHSPRLWSNSCCGHPRPGERTSDAARRRLAEEMGLDCYLTESFSFIYSAVLGGGLIEHELDHVLTGFSRCDPRPDTQEVEEWRWSEAGAVSALLEAEPATFSAWFAPAFERLISTWTPAGRGPSTIVCIEPR